MWKRRATSSASRRLLHLMKWHLYAMALRRAFFQSYRIMASILELD
jgi:hypothetical protein